MWTSTLARTLVLERLGGGESRSSKQTSARRLFLRSDRCDRCRSRVLYNRPRRWNSICGIFVPCSDWYVSLSAEFPWPGVAEVASVGRNRPAYQLTSTRIVLRSLCAAAQQLWFRAVMPQFEKRFGGRRFAKRVPGPHLRGLGPDRKPRRIIRNIVVRLAQRNAFLCKDLGKPSKSATHSERTGGARNKTVPKPLEAWIVARTGKQRKDVIDPREGEIRQIEPGLPRACVSFPFSRLAQT